MRVVLLLSEHKYKLQAGKGPSRIPQVTGGEPA